MSLETSPWTDFSKTLMQDFATQYGAQSDILKALSTNLLPMIQAGGFGFDNSTLAALRTGATDTVAQQYQNAQQALNERQAVNGDVNLPSGVKTMQQGALAAAAAGTTAKAQNDITLQNEQVRQQNLWNAVNGLQGVTAQFNPLGFAGGANQSGMTAADIQNSNANLMRAEQGGFWGQLQGGLAKGLAAFATGGFSSLGDVLGGAGPLASSGGKP